MSKCFLSILKIIILNHVKRIEELFRTDLSDEEFILYLTATKNGGQAVNVKDMNGKTYHISLFNPLNGSKEHNWMQIYHETVHNFMPHVFNNNAKLLQEYEKYSAVLKVEYNSNFRMLLDETITRAMTAILLEKHHGADVAQRNMQFELSRGWKNNDKIFDFTKKNYLQNSKYSSFEEFFPEIMEYIN